MLIHIDYQSFHNLQVEMQSLKKRIISKVSHKGKVYQCDFVSYLHNVRQLRLMESSKLGETRFFDVMPEDFNIISFFIYDLKS